MGKGLNLNGICNVKGGEYDSVYINGIGKIYSDISAKKIILMGLGKAKNSIKAEKLTIDGVFKVEEDLKLLKGRVNGVLKNKKNISVKNLEVNGTLKTNNLDGENINIFGQTKIKNNCQCEEVKIEGRVSIEGLLSGEKISIKSEKFSRIKEVGGASIRIENSEPSILNKLIFWKDSSIRIDLIEGDDVFLENVTCDLVRGRKVEVGRGCKIKKIEYSEEAILNKESKIKECIRG